MNERDFVGKKRETWDQLAVLLDKAGGRRGVRALNRDELLALGPLYRRVSTDLALARTQAISPDLISYLNGLVGRAHALLYEAETSGNAARSVVQFYLTEFPTLLQRHVGYFLAAVGVSALGLLFAYWLVITHPDKLSVFIPEQLKSSVDAWKSGHVTAGPHPEMSSWLMTHNLTVGLLSASVGICACIPTASLLFDNGAMLGAMAALMTQVHKHQYFWPGILPHGIAELTAIFICGAAGFLMGKALLLPGRAARIDAFKAAGLTAIKLVLGTIPLFIFAGIIEGMFSHLGLRPAFRYAFAGLNGLLWYLYLFVPRRETSKTALLEK
jgi:uncharacterized membrane protein SpoIIM required for sporulation